MIDNLASWITSIPTDEALWIVVLVFIGLDVLMGTVKAALNHEISSTKARQGVMHKIGFIGAMLLCNLIDIAQSVADFGYSVPVTAMCAVMIVLCEIMSICEHIQDMNPDINLSFLKDAQKGDRNEGEED